MQEGVHRMIRFCHIAPVNYLHLVRNHPTHLLLAHLIEENAEYRDFYINLKKENPSLFYHVDNSAFEMFKRGKPMYPMDKLIEMATIVNGNSIVMSDYPKEHWSKTVDAAKELIPTVKAAGFKTFFCPQSELGAIDDLLSSFEWAIQNTDIDFIGVSILACPIGLGVNESDHGNCCDRDDGYRLQRFLSRWQVFNLLMKERLLTKKTWSRFHCLGMTDGPREIEVLREFHSHIFSWDSSSAIWHGINGVEYDQSPTGLRNGKLETEVDFDIDYSDNNKSVINNNITLIDKMCGRFNEV